ncbi:uncharacterized protein LOC132200266 [Neocloeon triangulifer]|uniref:uncharacterized protein LOC132200266 n=1 Tax=Neocloeon triangulifer TaxID=2078957 RepID=UPI00286FAA6A|nr:uncharacterized protein LOC132200266 [Neocloeon triangulifer]
MNQSAGLLITSLLAISVLAAYDKHPCLRSCDPSTLPMTCHYDFQVELYQTLSKACFACAFGNASDCFRDDCIFGDGISRPVVVVNRKLPGPEIRVCLGDRIIVDVHNSLVSETTSLHWHGHHQRGSPHMDGVPLVTQCPISPASTFRYNFVADSPGTHFWHSHSGVQRGDGVFGALIIQDPKDAHSNLYDFDLPEHTIVLNDWYHEATVGKFVAHHFGNGDNKPPSILVNGKGRLWMSNDSAPQMPLQNFQVTKGKKYRFRLINSGFNNCPMELSVDNHTLAIIASDGFSLQPTSVDSLVSYAGERFDFVLEANQTVGRFWMRIRGLMDCDERFQSVHQVAIISYQGSDLTKEPKSPVGYREANRRGKQLNSMNVDSFNGDESTATIAEVLSLEPGDVDVLTAKADHTVYIGYDFYAKDNPLFHPAGKYGFDEVFRKSERLTTPQLNHITLKLPPTPLILQTGDALNKIACNDSSLAMQGKDCKKKDFCKCFHRIKARVNDIVDFVIFDEGERFDANHPFHLHGHAFHVMAIKRLGNATSLTEVRNIIEQGQVNRKNLHAPLKDTVTVPDGGFSLLRVKASNPGVWMFHCHIGFHVEIGMAFVFQVGEPEEFAPKPKGFPQCGDWKPSSDGTVDSDEKRIVLINGVKDTDKISYQILHNITVNLNHQPPPPADHGIIYSWPNWLRGKNSAPRDRLNLGHLIVIFFITLTF